jgi:hypothetical protein
MYADFHSLFIRAAIYGAIRSLCEDNPNPCPFTFVCEYPKMKEIAEAFQSRMQRRGF